MYLCAMVSIQIINKSSNALPKYATMGAAGMDVHAHLNSPLSIAPGQRVLVPTALYIAIPCGYEVQLRARSSWALKKGLILPNAPATIDSDYRGEIKVIMANISTETQTIHPGDRMAQMVLAKYEHINWKIVEQLPPTTRGNGGFGSTGVGK